MNSQFQYHVRGLAYALECLNPFSNTIAIKGLPAELKLLAYKRDGVGRGLYRRKIHEPGLTKLLLTRYTEKRARNFIDVGANIGYFACLMSKLAGEQGRVLALEPEPENFKLLEANLKRNGATNVEAIRCAAGERDTTATLGVYKAANRGRHSLLDLPSESAIKVPVRRLDDVVTPKYKDADAYWALLKIDVEGYEAFVLQGASRVLARTETMVIEYSPEFLRKAGVDPASFVRDLGRDFPKISRFEGAEVVPITVEDCARSTAQMDLVFDR